MPDERDVALQAQRGDMEAFEALVRAYEEAAFRAAYLIVRNEAEAQDVAQEAFVRAYRSLGRFDPEKPFRPWLLRIVTNLALNSIRGARRRDDAGKRLERAVDVHASMPSPEAAALAGEQSQRLWQALGELDEQDQAVLYLRYFLDVSEQEAAAAIRRPAGTVKSRLHRALGRLRVLIEERYPDLAPVATGETRTKA
ncbi:MAG TPA: sigma-70 family RNA polymerase sigma factor [Dehalococcoidia bacterium]|nr:sigma-70 family RNA polymerase sigma factor [Dehalococcoidia bacterium]